LAPISHAASGLLHSAGRPMPGALSGLAPASWRLGINEIPNSNGFDFIPYDTAKAAGARTTVIVSDAWFQTSGCGRPSSLCGAKPPWNDLGSYAAWVTSYVRRIEATGRHPDFWEVQNEPDSETIPGAYLTSWDAQQVTAQRELAQFDTAYHAIKAADPNAKVMGPSLAVFRTVPIRNYLDMATFMAYSASHGLVWDAISWHENGGYDAQGPALYPEALIGSHVAAAKALLAAHPTLGQPVIALTELGDPSTRTVPGWVAGNAEAVESLGVGLANRSCFPTVTDPTVVDPCWVQPNTLDSLLRSDGATTAAYWVMSAYASLAGTRVSDTVSDPAFSVLPAIAPHGNFAALIGRHQTCTRLVNPNCSAPPGVTPGPVRTSLSVALPWSGPALVVVRRIRNTSTELGGPSLVATVPVGVTGGTVVVSLPSVADGDAFVVDIRRL
jgi:hypothetical protein